MDPQCALIQLKDVSKIYKTPAGDFTALKGINLCFGEGEFVSVMGKSGSGKSTLINMIAGIDHPTSGAVRVGNTNVHKMSEGELAVWRGRSMGIVFQFFQLLPMLSVLENTVLPMDFCNMYAANEREQRALALLEMVGLHQEADKLPSALSGGQQQIAAIARALANDPPIIVADEPTGNLDSRTAEHVLDIFDGLVEQGKTIIIVTHDSSLAQRASRRVLIADGELVNEHVVQALPMLSHPQMLQVTHQAEPRTYAAGATIARRGALDAGLYLVTHGVVEVLRLGAHGAVEVLERLKPGQYFSALEITESQNYELSFRAMANGPVRVLCLGIEAFKRLVSETPTGQAAYRRLALERSSVPYPRGGSPRRWRV
jgi:ABC-type lipoprotein export system ATPase subunit